MHITAKVDYAVRTLVELAAVGPDPAKAEFLAKSQVIPHKFLEAVLSDLRRGGLVNSVEARTGDTGSLGPRTRSRLRRHTSCRRTAGFDSGSATGRRRLRGTGNAPQGGVDCSASQPPCCARKCHTHRCCRWRVARVHSRTDGRSRGVESALIQPGFSVPVDAELP